mmetsp:Transcript_88097/g.161631  ORF Transcript_88097/g.161631 Transcript_88097/m.161631 type:complete len:558 (-) Transcript_88097:14-1687(-)
MAGGQVQDDLLYLLFFWIATWLSVVLADFTRLSPLVYYLIFGCVLGNLEWVKHTQFLTSFSEFSIAIVFFALGLEENVAHFMEGIKKAWGIASIGALVPFGCGFGCSLAFWPDLDIKAALMGGLAVTATAVSLTMIALKAEGLATSKPAIGIMTSAVLDDIASLALVAIMVPIASGESEPTAAGIAWILGKAALFFLSIIVAHNIVLPHNVETGCLSKIPLVRTYGIHHMLRQNQGEQATLISLTFGLFFGMVAVWFGFHPAIGAYMSGLIMEEHYYDLDDDGFAGNTYQYTLHHIENAAYGWLGPCFFINLGASIIIDGEVLANVIWYTLIFFAAMFVGQFSSATIAARFVPGGFTWAEAAMIGFGMLGRAELFFVVLNLCYVENDIMPKEMFYTFTFTAMLLNVSVPVCITLFKPVYMRSKGKKGPKAFGLKRSKTIEKFSEKFVDTAVGRMLFARAKKKELKKQRRIFRADFTAPPSDAETTKKTQLGVKSPLELDLFMDATATVKSQDGRESLIKHQIYKDEGGLRETGKYTDDGLPASDRIESDVKVESLGR